MGCGGGAENFEIQSGGTSKAKVSRGISAGREIRYAAPSEEVVNWKNRKRKNAPSSRRKSLPSVEFMGFSRHSPPRGGHQMERGGDHSFTFVRPRRVLRTSPSMMRKDGSKPSSSAQFKRKEAALTGAGGDLGSIQTLRNWHGTSSEG